MVDIKPLNDSPICLPTEMPFLSNRRGRLVVTITVVEQGSGVRACML